MIKLISIKHGVYVNPDHVVSVMLESVYAATIGRRMYNHPDKFNEAINPLNAAVVVTLTTGESIVVRVMIPGDMPGPMEVTNPERALYNAVQMLAGSIR